ncbi:Detected protein of confused Function [Hibiscus syriacus]|uniref:Detected protein of confused Function n=1 Tax=Hibiscus syriacus TaxID=106335 RepID=A0A6A3C988_HIBSY|nr:zinc finger protein CONSTANS-LIKE 7-like [Hibiscus syriacus]KAE8725314.1 Detected protein of confused Function [Hibiscus syriacus]
MSYNLSVSDDSSFNRCVPEVVSTDTIDYQSLFDLPFSSFCDSSSGYNIQENTVVESDCADQVFADLLPSHQLENLSLCQTTQFPSLCFGYNTENGYGNLEVKNEESIVDFDSAYADAHNNGGKFLQRSFSSNSFEGKSSFLFRPFESLMESHSFHGQALSLPENSFFISQMRKVSSTGDLESMRNVHNTQRSISTPSTMEDSINSSMEESPFKVGRYNAEERQEKILKYKAKRSQRNFNKTIKYACRKTLADTRPRIRGRFARNDETIESPQPTCSTRDEGEDNLWVMLHEVDDEEMGTRGTLMNSLDSQFQFQFKHGYF